MVFYLVISLVSALLMLSIGILFWFTKESSTLMTVLVRIIGSCLIALGVLYTVNVVSILLC